MTEKELELITQLAKETSEAIEAIAKRLNEHTDQLKAAEDRIKALEEGSMSKVNTDGEWAFDMDAMRSFMRCAIDAGLTVVERINDKRLNAVEEALNKHLMEERKSGTFTGGHDPSPDSFGPRNP